MPNSLPPLQIKGQTIQLELLRTAPHYNPLKHAANYPVIWCYMPMRADREAFDRWFEESIAEQEKGVRWTYVIRRLVDGEVIGCRAYVDLDFSHKKCEVGYGWLTPNAWCKPYNHESLYLLFHHAFESWQLNRVQIATDPRNIKNYNNLKKLGAVQEALLRQHMIHHTGLVTDTVLFSILADEWPRVKRNLHKRLSNFNARMLEKNKFNS